MKVPIAIIIGAIIVSFTIHYSLRFNPKNEILKLCITDKFNNNYIRDKTLQERLKRVKEECY